MGVLIEHYTAERVPNYDPAGDPSWEKFAEVRQSVLKVCARHGTTGPDLEYDIKIGPDFWVVDDRYNAERYQYVQVYKPSLLTAQWIADMMAALAEHPCWGVGVSNITGGYLLIFGDRLMVTGPFHYCNDLESVAITAAKNLWGTKAQI